MKLQTLMIPTFLLVTAITHAQNAKPTTVPPATVTNTDQTPPVSNAEFKSLETYLKAVGEKLILVGEDLESVPEPIRKNNIEELCKTASSDNNSFLSSKVVATQKRHLSTFAALQILAMRDVIKEENIPSAAAKSLSEKDLDVKSEELKALVKTTMAEDYTNQSATKKLYQNQFHEQRFLLTQIDKLNKACTTNPPQANVNELKDIATKFISHQTKQIQAEQPEFLDE